MKWGYPLVEIGELVSSVNKWNPRQSKNNELIKYIDIASVNREAKKVENIVEVFAHEAPSRARQLIMDGDIIVSTVRPNLNAVAHLKTGLSGATASTGFTVLRSNSKKVCDRYLYYWVRSPYFIQDMVRLSSGASYPAVSDSIIKAYKIPLPALEEQKSIAAILDKADAIRRSRQKAIALTEELLRSTFLDMFGDPVTNPKGWKVKPLSELCTKITDGTHKTPTYVADGISFLSAKNVKAHKIDWVNTKFIEEKEHNSLINRCHPESGDILLTKSGSIGAAAIVDRNTSFSLFESLALIKIADKKIVSSIFLASLLNSQSIKGFYARNTKGVAIKHLHLVDIRKLPIIVPPKSQQEVFVKMTDSIKSLESRVNKHYLCSDNLFNSLLQKAFRGEL